MVEEYSQKRKQDELNSEAKRFGETVIGTMGIDRNSSQPELIQFMDLDRNFYLATFSHGNLHDRNYVSLEVTLNNKDSHSTSVTARYDPKTLDYDRLHVHRSIDYEGEFLEDPGQLLIETSYMINKLLAVLPKYPHLKA